MDAINTADHQQALKRAVIDYVMQDLRVFPLHDVIGGSCSCGNDCGQGGKHPRIADWPKKATKDYKKALAWWQQWPNANIGIVTGHTFFVLDKDKPEAWDRFVDELSGQLTADGSPLVSAITGSGMEHYLFRYPEGADITNRQGTVPKGVDIRGRGGYIVAAPSISSKGQYRVPEHIDYARLPKPSDALLARLARTSGQPKLVSKNSVAGFDSLPTKEQKRIDAYWKRVREDELDKLRNLGSLDEWNNTLHAVACNLFEFANSPWAPVDFDEVEDAILEAIPPYDGEGWNEYSVEKTIASARKHIEHDANCREFPEVIEESEAEFLKNISAAFLDDADLKDEEYQFLWQDRITANDFCLLQGDGGVGKGSFAAWLMAELSNGKLPGIYEGVPTTSLFISTEEVYNKATKPRLKAQSYNPAFVKYFDLQRIMNGDMLTLDPWKTKILFKESARRGIRVVIFDPIQDFFPDAVNPDVRKDVRDVLRRVQNYGQEFGITVIGIHHENKGAHTNAADKGAGSKAFRDVARSGFRLTMSTDEGSREGLATLLKNNYSAGTGGFSYEIVSASVTGDAGQQINTSKFVILEDIDLTANDVVRTEQLSEKDKSFRRKQGTSAEIALGRMLLDAGDEGVSPERGKWLAKSIGVSEQTIRRTALNSLVKEGVAENTGGRGKKDGVWRCTDRAKMTQYLKAIEPTTRNIDFI